MSIKKCITKDFMQAKAVVQEWKNLFRDNHISVDVHDIEVVPVWLDDDDFDDNQKDSLILVCDELHDGEICYSRYDFVYEFDPALLWMSGILHRHDWEEEFEEYYDEDEDEYYSYPVSIENTVDVVVGHLSLVETLDMLSEWAAYLYYVEGVSVGWELRLDRKYNLPNKKVERNKLLHDERFVRENSIVWRLVDFAEKQHVGQEVFDAIFKYAVSMGKEKTRAIEYLKEASRPYKEFHERIQITR